MMFLFGAIAGAVLAILVISWCDIGGRNDHDR